MTNVRNLYKNNRFLRVSDQTKTDIISAIGIEINDAKEEIKESKFSQEELKQALHYLLATEAKKKRNVESLLVRENANLSPKDYVSSPFYFSNNDPWLWYSLGQITGPSQYPSGSGTLSGGGCGGGDGRGAALLVAAVCVCGAGVCCVHQMRETLNSPESDEVKLVKVSGSSIAGFLVFFFLLSYLTHHDVWRQSLVEDQHWDFTSYRFLLLLVAAFSGLAASGTVSTVNNIWRCLPNSEREIPPPSKEMLVVLKDLEVIKTLLSKGWAHRDDDPEQCKEFIREVILMYIKDIAAPELRVTTETVPLLAPASQMTVFRPVPVPTAPPLSTDGDSHSGSYKRLP